MEQLIYTLLAYINNSLNKDINYNIAKSMLENIDKIESFSLDSVSEACNVAPSTINRFCKRIGFKNFSHMRNSVAIPAGFSIQEQADHGITTPSFLKQLEENSKMIDEIAESQLEWIVQQIKQSKKIVILGFEKHQIQAMELQKKLVLLGKLCECGTNLYKQMDGLSDVTDADMIITISIQGNILSHNSIILEKIKAARGKKLLLTFSNELEQLEGFHQVLQCGRIENSSVSSYTLLRLFDVLMNRYQRYDSNWS
ncbi:MurR/RpiR family transcriptional regulator [Litchfieldia salsa]|uniref:Helix-turn-helix domain-containing protein, rpiR family n=1 Tax=Litchfieldia salsa TaxID=930152 RepID=A0A1H0PPJ7_9BACI|nr:MurR/RpiR family transcriptional regulator [Litchfieldia salsa]SDP06914.1 Helix-turn-helix domain-containing protein, rpiR family [Litchfieldia salsa]